MPHCSCRQIADPCFFPVKLYAFRAVVHGFCYRTDKEGRAKHIFISHGHCPGILSEVKDQATHNGAVFLICGSCQRINVGHQSITQIDVFLNGIVGRIAFLAEIPDLSGRVCSVGAEHGQETAIFEPAHIQFTITRIFYTVIVFPFPEP